MTLPEDLLSTGLGRVLDLEGVEAAEISVTFLEDAAIQALNQEYLGRDRPTDVIAFSLHDPGDPPLGDVYVGYDQASRQARALRIPLQEELLRLAIHGVLHVLGHSHPEGTGREKSPMYIRQEELLKGILAAG
jgi:probable rRNA maturation factor